MIRDFTDSHLKDMHRYTDKPFQSSFWEPEFDDFYQIFELGAKKYARDNWKHADGITASFSEMHDKIFHHLARSFGAGVHGDRKDEESKLDHILHAITRLQMVYWKLKRGIYE